MTSASDSSYSALDHFRIPSKIPLAPANSNSAIVSSQSVSFNFSPSGVYTKLINLNQTMSVHHSSTKNKPKRRGKRRKEKTHGATPQSETKHPCDSPPFTTTASV